MSADREDDALWGEIIRKHFRANGRRIIRTVSEWCDHTRKGKSPEDPLLKELEDALIRHGFLQDA